MAAPPDDFQMQDSGWAHFKIIDSSGKKFKCKWCGKEIKGGGITRGKQHLAGITGQVKKCDKCPKEVSDEFRALLLGYKSQKQKMAEQEAELREKIASRRIEKGKGLATPARGVSIHERGDPTHRPMDDSSDSSDDSDPQLAAARKASMQTLQQDEARRQGAGTSGTGRTGRIGRTGKGGSGSTIATRTRAAVHEKSAKESEANEALKGLKGMKGAVKCAMKGIVKWFVHAGVPASKASSPYFGEMIEAIAKAGPEMLAPTGDMILSWAVGDPIDIYDQPFEPARHSEEMAETPRLHQTDTPLRRTASQVDRRKGKEPIKKKQKQKKKQKPQAKQSEEQTIGLTEDTPMDTPSLPPHLAQLYEQEQKYRRRKKQAKQEEVAKSRQKISRQPVGSDDSTQAPSDDDDDDDAAAAALTGATFHGRGSGYQESHQPDIEHEEGQRSGQGQQGGYEGQQRGAGIAGYDWGYGGSYSFFHPPRLAYSDISSTSWRGDGHSPIQSGQSYPSDFTFPTAIIAPSRESGENSSQINTPRGVTRGVHELVDSIFGTGHRQTFDYGRYCNPDDEGSRM